MAKKKLQIEELKVKSFVTVVEKGEQKTAKGGIVNFQTQGYILQDINGHKPWTEWKTRAGFDVDILKTENLEGGGGKRRG